MQSQESARSGLRWVMPVQNERNSWSQGPRKHPRGSMEVNVDESWLHLANERSKIPSEGSVETPRTPEKSEIPSGSDKMRVPVSGLLGHRQAQPSLPSPPTQVLAQSLQMRNKGPTMEWGVLC